MNTRTISLVGGGAIAAAVVAGVILSLQSFDAGKVPCEGIAEARANLEALHKTGVDASVAVYADEKGDAEERLSQCLSAKPADPCEDAQRVRDAAVLRFNSIVSPPDTAPSEAFQAYFAEREIAYNEYVQARDALRACREANPPKEVVPYEESDAKACFDAYDASLASMRDTFEKETQAMRSALQSALSALDAREKACNPPTGDEQFTSIPGGGNGAGEGSVSAEQLRSCLPLDPHSDAELRTLRTRAAAIPGEIQAVQTSIDNIDDRMSPLTRDLSEVDTYIPPESTKTQYEGALNALRAERKVAIESALGFYKNMKARRQTEKDVLESELRDIEAKIATRMKQIEDENAARQRDFPTALRHVKPDACDYYHCHGLLCGVPDPASNGCGHGATTESDVECKDFLDAYLKQAGVR